MKQEIKFKINCYMDTEKKTSNLPEKRYLFLNCFHGDAAMIHIKRTPTPLKDISYLSKLRTTLTGQD